MSDALGNLPVLEGLGSVNQDALLRRILWKLDLHALPPALLVRTHVLHASSRTEEALSIAVLFRRDRELL